VSGQAESDHQHAHDGAAGESDLQPLGQTRSGRVRGAGVGGGGDAHAEEAGHPRTQGADDKTQDNPALFPLEDNPEQDRHHHHKDGEHAVFADEKGHRALADGVAQFLHFLRTRILPVNPTILPNNENKGDNTREKCQPEGEKVHGNLVEDLENKTA